MRGSAGAGGFERPRVLMCLGLPAMVLGGLCFRDPSPGLSPKSFHDFRERGLQARDSFASAQRSGAGEKVRMRGSAGAGGFERLRVLMCLGLPAMVLGGLAYSGPLTRPLPKIVSRF